MCFNIHSSMTVFTLLCRLLASRRSHSSDKNNCDQGCKKRRRFTPYFCLLVVCYFSSNLFLDVCMKICISKELAIRSDLWSVSKLLQIWTTNELKRQCAKLRSLREQALGSRWSSDMWPLIYLDVSCAAFSMWHHQNNVVFLGCNHLGFLNIFQELELKKKL